MIALVARAWSGIASDCSIAVELAHHTRKQSSGSTVEATVDDGRGASALKDKARSVRVLNVMSKEEAEAVSIDQTKRRSYFRVDNGANMQPPAEKAVWRAFVSIPLGNETATLAGDWVGVVTAWELPGGAEVSSADLRAVQNRIFKDHAGCRKSKTSPAWAGRAVMEVLKISNDRGGRKRAAALLEGWLKDGTLKRVWRQGTDRHHWWFIEVDKWV
jgi:hypothetical protein